MTNDESPNTQQRTDESTSPAELRADIEQTRANLGQTVETLAGRVGLKPAAREAAGKAADKVATQARQTFEAARHKAGPVAQQAQDKARDFATKARHTATSDEAKAQARGGGAATAAAATGAVLLVVWLRRRRARRMTRWQRTMRTAQQTAQRTGAQMRGRAAGLGTTVRASEITAQAAARGQAAAAELGARARRAAGDPDSKPRAQGAVVAMAALLVMSCLRRARRRGRTE